VTGPALMTVAEAAAYLSVKPGWLLDQAQRGRIARVKSGKVVRFRQADLDAWITDHMEPSERTA
jgi:excisionase family DNA binding protein